MRSSDHGVTRSSERVDRLEAIHAQLTAAVEDLTRSDAWRRMLTVATRLPTYSPSNILLIAIQKPKATRVAGYGTWKSLGGHVRKGEKGMAILAPCLNRRAEDPATQAAPEGRPADPDMDGQRQLRGFRVAHVFDVSQTEGDPLPDLAPEELAGGAPEQQWERLADLAQADGFTVERGACSHAYGYTRFDDRTIRIRDDVDPAQAVKTLAHEIGHIRADHENRFLDDYHRSPACRGRAEVEAESIAYLVTTVAGMDSSDYSVPYVANRSGGDTAILRETATKVLTTGQRIVHTLHGATPGTADSNVAPSAPYALGGTRASRPASAQMMSPAW